MEVWFCLFQRKKNNVNNRNKISEQHGKPEREEDKLRKNGVDVGGGEPPPHKITKPFDEINHCHVCWCFIVVVVVVII